MSDQQLIPAADDPRERAVALYGEAMTLARRSVETAWKCGQALIQAKTTIDHGQWLPWLDQAGINRKTAARWMSLPRLYPQMSQVETFASVDAALEQPKQVARAEREASARARRIAEAASGPGDWRVAHCAVADLIPQGVVAAEGVECVLSDPPYPREYLPAWSDLGAFAAEALVPGGLLIAVSGQLYLPDVMQRLAASGLAYQWTGAIVLAGSTAVVYPARLRQNWKPVLVYRRGQGPKDAPASRWMGTDLIRPPGTGARDVHHKWGQSASAMDRLAELWLEPGWRVVDPFAGGGETALAAWRRGCDVLAADIDPDVAALRIEP